jgi:hypothetical protein
MLYRRYYYLAWGDAAPLVSVACDWEDVTHRLLAANALSNAAAVSAGAGYALYCRSLVYYLVTITVVASTLSTVVFK